MSRIRSAITIFLAIAALCMPILAFAAGSNYGLTDVMNTVNGGKNGTVLPTKILNATTLPEAIGAIVSGLLGLLGIVFFGIILYAGFMWMLARGSSEKVDAAKDMIQNAIIGLLIVLLAYALTRFIFTFFETGQTNTQTGQGFSAGAVCEQDTECAPPLVCINKMCQQASNSQNTGKQLGEACGQDADCAAPNSCVNSVCAAPQQQLGGCEAAKTCGAGKQLMCFVGDFCCGNGDCISNICTNNKCQ